MDLDLDFDLDVDLNFDLDVDCDLGLDLDLDLLVTPRSASFSTQFGPDGVEEHLQNCSPTITTKSFAQNSINFENATIDLTSIMRNDPSISALFNTKWMTSAYVHPDDCQVIAKGIVDAVVQSFGLKRSEAMMEALAKGLVKLYPFLGDLTDPDLGYKIYYCTSRVKEGFEFSGYFYDRLRYHQFQARLLEKERADLDWKPLEASFILSTASRGGQPCSTADLVREEALARRILVETRGGIWAVMKIHPHVFTRPGLIIQDFYAMYPNLRDKFARNWPLRVERLYEYSIKAYHIAATGILKYHCEWDEGDKALAACILLPHILKTAGVKRKLTEKEMRSFAGRKLTKRERAAEVVQFVGSGVGEVVGDHPHIVIEGCLELLVAHKISVFIHGHLVPSGTISEAVETLFASHFVFRIPFPTQTRPILNYLLFGVYDRAMLASGRIPLSLRHLVSQTRGPPRLNISFTNFGNALACS